MGTLPHAMDGVSHSPSDPTVSILITAYNREDFVGEAIESVIQSTYTDWEMIIVDDGSLDATYDLCCRYAEKDHRIHVYRNETNLGDYPNRNRAAELARGRYLKYVDSDDHLYPHSLAYLVSLMEEHPEAGYALSQDSFVNRPHPILLSPYEAYFINFFHYNLFVRSPNSAFIRTDAFRQIGGFSGKRHVGDHEIWLKLSRHYPLLTTPPALAWDRTHPGQEKSLNREKKLGMHQQIQQEALEHNDCPLNNRERQWAWHNVQRSYRKDIFFTLFRYRQLRRAINMKRYLNLSWFSILKFPISTRFMPPMPSKWD
ncbi:glycosyltransferase family 2 protein [Magnetococcus sp. PR-3]|uniref:glycosyltransferase family 2 protein n=1 Tax=Magnetococcus sp. PR-3 TaxID=3120355 RepID=UPI002FCE0A21